MTALLVVRHNEPAQAQRLLNLASGSLTNQGFPEGVRVPYHCGLIEWRPTPRNPESLNQLQQPEGPESLIACVGTLFYKQRTGARALVDMWHDFRSPDRFDWTDLWGNYLVLVLKFGKVWMFGDPIGSVKLYHTTDKATWSTSFLACASNVRRHEVDRIGAIDYVVSGSNHGDRTPLEAIRIADSARSVELSTQTWHTLSSRASWTSGVRPRQFNDAVETAAALLTSRARTIAATFGNAIHCALSGGFDSRLILASLRAVGTNPHLHVYGQEGDEDVQIAKQVATQIGAPIQHIDKNAINRGLPPITKDALIEQLLFFDGMPTDGIFDRGADRITRIRQSDNNALALNGGGGEIFRNFFYLHDKPFSASDVYRAFYSAWHPDAVPLRIDRDEYRDYMTAAIEHSLSASGVMPRSTIELIYPLFRVRYWTARNTSQAARSGHFLTPLVDPELVRFTHELPLRWKDYGKFEAALIGQLDASLSKVPLTYGFRPNEGPSLSYRVKMWAQHRRPPMLRANSMRIRTFFKRTYSTDRYSSDNHCETALADWTDVLDTSYLFDSGQRTRASTLATLLSHLAETTHS